MAQPVLNQDFWSAMGYEPSQIALGMDDDERAAIEVMHQRVREMMAQEQAQESYFQRQDNGKLVKTQAEYQHCSRKRIPLKIVDQAEAEALLMAEDQARNLRKEKKERRKARRRRG